MTFDEIFSTFYEISFPEPSLNYVIYAVGLKLGEHFVPFYVGQTHRSVGGRIGDYASAQATAKTDFKVGVAVKTIRSRQQDVKVEVKFKKASEEPKKRRQDEESLRRKVEEEFKSKHFSSGLLNTVRLKYKAKKPMGEDFNRAKKDIEEWVTKFLQDMKAHTG